MQELEKILEEIKGALKETYLDISNNYDVSDLSFDNDKVACVASKFRCAASSRIERIIRKHIVDKAVDDGWIPVEERLPDDYAQVLVSMYDNIGWITIGTYNSMQRKWNVNEYITNLGIDVKAWQPLPEPYRPQK